MTPSLTVGSRSSTGSEFQTVGPPTEKARRPSVLRRYRGTIRLQVGWSSMSTGNVGDRSAAVDQIPWCFVLQTPTDHDSQFVLHAFRNVEPVELVVNQRWQTAVVLATVHFGTESTRWLRWTRAHNPNQRPLRHLLWIVVVLRLASFLCIFT